MIEQTFPLSGPADLDVSFPSGSLVVETGPADSVTVKVDTDRPDSWSLLQNGDAIAVIFERGGFGRGGRARVNILAPAGSSLKVGTASADVRTRISLDRVTLATASGDIHLVNVNTATVKTASGDVSVARAVRDLSVRSASGDVSVVAAEGSVSVTTASGDTAIEKASGPVVFSSASGDLRVDAYLGNDVEASTLSGDLVIGLPEGVRVKLQATTLSGKVHLPESRKHTTSAEARQISVQLKSVSGDVRLHRI